jgi:type I restriction enzyme S subunit
MKRLQAETAAELNAHLPSILDKAFKGELVHQDPNDEPASVLLQRIKQQREKAGLKKSLERQQVHVAGA